MNNIDYKAVVEILENFLKKEKTEILGISVGEEYQLRQAIENLIQENKKLEEYKKIAELTKISCCTAQNCEALNNAIKNGLENEKLIQENKELKDKIMKLNNQNLGTQSYNEFFNK